MNRVKNLAILNLVFFMIAFTVSNLSQLKIFGGITNKTISDKYDTVFTPAGVTFSIWGVIYLALFGFTIYKLVQSDRADAHDSVRQDISKIGYLFVINNIATTFWIFAFTYEYLLVSVLLIIVQFITLLMIAVRLNLYDHHKMLANKVFTQFPLSIYFAWICVATIANISLYLVSIGWDGFGIAPDIWAVIMIIVTIILAIFMITAKRNPFFGLVIIWALYGIVLKRTEVDEIAFKDVIVTAWIGIGIISILTLYQLYKVFTYSKKLNA